eukprot:8717334-Pyramimonas_sp.AAC.1
MCIAVRIEKDSARLIAQLCQHELSGIYLIPATVGAARPNLKASLVGEGVGGGGAPERLARLLVDDGVGGVGAVEDAALRDQAQGGGDGQWDEQREWTKQEHAINAAVIDGTSMG